MVGVRKLKIRTEAFWRDEYEVSDADLDLVTSVILDAGKPQPLDALARSIITRRLQREKEAVAQQAKSGELYQPSGEYQEDQRLVFSALDFAVGHVVAVRTGYNPKYENFNVIRVAFEDGSPEREYAANFQYPHPLNRSAEELLGADELETDESDLIRRFEHYVARRLETALESHCDFLKFDGLWFLQALLPEIHVGHMNLAEAMIYEAGHPLVAREMLGELELGPGSADAQLFALNHALSADARFDNVGTTEQPTWYLRALEPEAVFARPAILKPAFRAVGGEYVGITMLDMIDEIGDEMDDIETLVLRDTQEISVELNFPHLYAGTLPLTSRMLRKLPTTPVHHFAMTLVDTQKRERFEVWGVPSDNYVAGLGSWYASVGMCVGGQMTLTLTDEPFTFEITFTPSRGRRSEWIRSAAAENNELAVQMQRAVIEVRCDRNMLIDVPNRDAVAQLMLRPERETLSLTATVRRSFEELAKLSSRGLVHAKSIYSLANLYRRTGTVPVFAELTRRACYDPVGDGFWAYDPGLVDKVYRTPEEMRERALSNHTDLVQDQVVQYVGT